jgi:hypothetical protein
MLKKAKKDEDKMTYTNLCWIGVGSMLMELQASLSKQSKVTMYILWY